jgi:hypothetical protein
LQVTGTRARILYNAGLRSIADVALCSEDELFNHLIKGQMDLQRKKKKGGKAV